MTDLDAIEAALRAATPGPWQDHAHSYHVGTGAMLPSIVVAPRGALHPVVCSVSRGNAHREADAHLIAHAPTWLAELVAEVRRLRAGPPPERVGPEPSGYDGGDYVVLP
jgi:hypothetical protein